MDERIEASAANAPTATRIAGSGVLLEDLRERGDRQRLYWAMLEL
ncbi:MAG: hypothetical protein R3C02_06430 [Planctomycetaceae bacterium]